MDDTTTLGAYLRAERERRDLTLRTISESTRSRCRCSRGSNPTTSRVGQAAFSGAHFVRTYAEAVGLDPDDVFRRFERQYKPASARPGYRRREAHPPAEIVALAQASGGYRGWSGAPSNRARYLGTAADLTVALVLAFGSAAAGSRLLWPVLLIAAYYAAGVLLTGTSPMVALLGETGRPASVRQPTGPSRPDDVDSMLGHSSPGTIS